MAEQSWQWLDQPHSQAWRGLQAFAPIVYLEESAQAEHFLPEEATAGQECCSAMLVQADAEGCAVAQQACWLAEAAACCLDEGYDSTALAPQALLAWAVAAAAAAAAFW